MNKLNKPRAFEASESITTSNGIEIANLLRSGIINQSVILVGQSGKWHEIEITNMGVDNVVLEWVKDHIELHNLSLSDLGITESRIDVDYSLKHEDFVLLSEKFPSFDYVQISRLNDYNISKGKKGSIDVLKDDLTYFTRDGLSIEDYISDKPQQSIIVDTFPAPKDSVSLQMFEKLTPEKITELQGLRTNLEEIVKSNPVVIITDKKTYAEAKKTASILLSASTSIDGSKGVEATATKYLNTFKAMLKTAIAPLALIPRNPYNEQKKIIEDWDNRLLLRVQNRVKELFSIPFTYNSEFDSYSVGSLVVTQNDIENKTDAEFSSITQQGKAIVVALESVKNEQDSKIAEQAKQIEELKAMLLKLTPNEPAEKEVTYDLIAIVGAQEVKKEEKQYSLPNPDNKLLNELDLAHVSVLEEKQYLECREYYIQALQDASDSINGILLNPDKSIQKSVAITDLIKTWKC